jgi:hypothetical protein
MSQYVYVEKLSHAEKSANISYHRCESLGQGFMITSNAGIINGSKIILRDVNVYQSHL